MQFDMRWNGNYAELSIIEGKTIIKTGLLNAMERDEIISQLQTVIDYLRERPNA